MNQQPPPIGEPRREREEHRLRRVEPARERGEQRLREPDEIKVEEDDDVQLIQEPYRNLELIRSYRRLDRLREERQLLENAVTEERLRREIAELRAIQDRDFRERRDFEHEMRRQLRPEPDDRRAVEFVQIPLAQRIDGNEEPRVFIELDPAEEIHHWNQHMDRRQHDARVLERREQAAERAAGGHFARRSRWHVEGNRRHYY